MLAGVSRATVDRDSAISRHHGIERLKRFDWKSQPSELIEHLASLKEMFRLEPPQPKPVSELQRRQEASAG